MYPPARWWWLLALGFALRGVTAARRGPDFASTPSLRSRWIAGGRFAFRLRSRKRSALRHRTTCADRRRRPNGYAAGRDACFHRAIGPVHGAWIVLTGGAGKSSSSLGGGDPSARLPDQLEDALPPRGRRDRAPRNRCASSDGFLAALRRRRSRCRVEGAPPAHAAWRPRLCAPACGRGCQERAARASLYERRSSRLLPGTLELPAATATGDPRFIAST